MKNDYINNLSDLSTNVTDSTIIHFYKEIVT